MLNFHKLDVFLRVAQMGSFSRAAEGLLMTQSAVSHHIRDLERQLGTSLFERNSRGVTLTKAGETLQDYVLKIVALVAEAELAVTRVENLESGEVRIGATPGVSVYLLPDCIFTFRQAYPNLSVIMQTGTSQEMIALLRSIQIDVALIEGELEGESYADLKIQTLHRIEQKVIIGRGHSWWDRKNIELAELDNQEFVMRQPNSQTRIWLDNVLAQHGIHPKISTVFDNLDSIKRSVARGSSLSIMPAYTVPDELEQGKVQALSIVGKPLQRTLELVWKRDHPLSPPCNAFLDHIEQCIAKSEKTTAL